MKIFHLTLAFLIVIIPLVASGKRPPPKKYKGANCFENNEKFQDQLNKHPKCIECIECLLAVDPDGIEACLKNMPSTCYAHVQAHAPSCAKACGNILIILLHNANVLLY